MFFVTSHTHKHIAHTLELGQYFDVNIVHICIIDRHKRKQMKREKKRRKDKKIRKNEEKQI